MWGWKNILFFQFCILYLKWSGFQDYDICIKGNERGENSFWPTQIQRFSFSLVLIHMSCVIGSLKTGSHILRKSDCTFSLFILDHMFKMWLKGMSQTHKSDLYCGQMNFFLGGGGVGFPNNERFKCVLLFHRNLGDNRTSLTSKT